MAYFISVNYSEVGLEQEYVIDLDSIKTFKYIKTSEKATLTTYYRDGTLDNFTDEVANKVYSELKKRLTTTGFKMNERIYPEKTS